MSDDLQKFCTTEGGGYDLTTPFVCEDGYVYATDRRISVRRLATPDERFEPDPGRKTPDCPSHFAAFPIASPDRFYRPWPMPDGKLTGRGRPNEQQVGNRVIAGDLCWKILSLPSPHYDPTGSPEDALCFVAGNIQGMVGPLFPVTEE